MNTAASIESLAATIAAIAAHLGVAVVDVQPYDLPPLTPDEVVADGTTINADGSVWGIVDRSTSVLGGDGQYLPIGAKWQKTYGYIGPKKCPLFWKYMTAWNPVGFGAWIDTWKKQPLARYTRDPEAATAQFLASQPGTNGFLQVGMILSNGVLYPAS